MGDRITANLPARCMQETAAFYDRLGFSIEHCGPDWLAMRRGDLEIEFSPHPDLDPSGSWHSACVWVGDLDGLYAAWGEAGLPSRGVPRMTEIQDLASGQRMWSGPHQTGHAAWLADCWAMNSLGERMRKPE